MRVKNELPVELTCKESGEPFMFDSRDVSTVRRLKDGTAGICFRGRDSFVPVKETYEEARDKLFPDLSVALDDADTLEDAREARRRARYAKKPTE